MNTLKYKVLLIRQCFTIYRWAVGLYMLLTLPALFDFQIYFFSAIMVLFFGWIAFAVFTLLVLIVSFFATPSRVIPVMYVTIALAVVIAFYSLTFDATDVLQFGPFLLFPLAATVAGWIAFYKSQRKLRLIMALSRRRNHPIAAVL